MKIIELGIVAPIEKLSGLDNIHYCLTYPLGDLYEAEEVFLNKLEFINNRLIFINEISDQIFEPIITKKYQYIHNVIYENNFIYVLLVDFECSLISIYKISKDFKDVSIEYTQNLKEIKDCYNLYITSPLTLVKHNNDNTIDILYPYKNKFTVKENEVFLFRDKDVLYFETYDKGSNDSVIIKDAYNGRIIEKISGVLTKTEKGKIYILK